MKFPKIPLGMIIYLRCEPVLAVLVLGSRWFVFVCAILIVLANLLFEQRILRIVSWGRYTRTLLLNGIVNAAIIMLVSACGKALETQNAMMLVQRAHLSMMLEGFLYVVFLALLYRVLAVITDVISPVLFKNSRPNETNEKGGK